MRVLRALFYSGQTSGDKLPRRKQRGIVEGNPLIISPQGAGNLPVEIKTEVLRPPGMQKETETGSAAAMAGWE